MNELLKYCIDEVKKLDRGEIFTVKDLFKGYEWNRLTSGEKRNIKYIFKNYIYINKDLHVVNINQEEKNKKENLKYKKIP